MVNLWTQDEIEHILRQLDSQMQPFKKYRFTGLGQGMKLLGKGGYAFVYEAQNRDKQVETYAIKVIGFGEKHVDSLAFRQSVEAQQSLSSIQDCVVKVYDAIQLRIWLDVDMTVTKAQVITDELPEAEGDYLDLQFIVMEKLLPVLTADNLGRKRLYPPKLAAFEEAEIQQLAYEIGTALARAHENKLLHRDVKLENIFYDVGKKQYKLGDFGIAKVTDSGMASTVAFTKGYGAPEVVGALDDKYDNTADIYSFGMLLYLLLNHLKFPDSDGYTVNAKEQYSQGYILPFPESSYWDLYAIAEQMCSFHPEERYQTVDEMLNDLADLMIQPDVSYKKEHKGASFVVGTLFLLAGVVLWKLIFAPETVVHLSASVYIVCAAALLKSYLKNSVWDTTSVSLIIFVFGVISLIRDGFGWWKLIGLLGITLSSGTFAGLFAGAVLTVTVTSLLTNGDLALAIAGTLQDARWIVITLLSLAAVLFLQYSVLESRDWQILKTYFKGNSYLLSICFIYAVLILYGWSMKIEGNWLLAKIVGEDLVNTINSLELSKVGVAGLAFCLTWMVREKVLRKINIRNGGNVQ